MPAIPAHASSYFRLCNARLCRIRIPATATVVASSLSLSSSSLASSRINTDRFYRRGDDINQPSSSTSTSTAAYRCALYLDSRRRNNPLYLDYTY